MTDYSDHLIGIAYLARIIGVRSQGLYSTFRKHRTRILKKGRIYYVGKPEAIAFVERNYPNNPEYVETIKNTF